MDKQSRLKNLQKKFSELSSYYHQQVINGKTTDELMQLILRIKITLAEMKAVQSNL